MPSPNDVEVIWKPQPGPQTALIACPIFEVFYGGARGGGKTEGSIGDWLQHSGQYGEHATGIFVRRTLKQLSEVIARTKNLFPKIGAKFREQPNMEWTMANGARLKFVHLERDSDAENYQGHSYTRVYVEEVTNFPSPGPVDKLRATLRSAAGVPCALRLTGNPGGPGHAWVKKRYIDPAPGGFKVISDEYIQIMHYDPVRVLFNGEPMEIPLYGVHFIVGTDEAGRSIVGSLDGKTQVVLLDNHERVARERVFIPSKLSDNLLLMQNDPLYALNLRQAGSEALVRAWLAGDWSIIDGAFFECFDPTVHVLGNEWIERIPAGAHRFRAFDWGSAKPFSVGWYAVSDGTWGLPPNALFKYREWYGATGPNVGLKMTAEDVARGILERERGEAVRWGMSVADPAIFVRDGGPSIGEKMAMIGCMFRKADNKRVPGWAMLRQYLVGDKGLPMLYFAESCEDTIRTIPLLQHDERDAEDLDTDGEDHAADETRYACMSRPWFPRAAQSEPGIAYPKLPHEYTFNDLVALSRKRRLEEEAA